MRGGGGGGFGGSGGPKTGAHAGIMTSLLTMVLSALIFTIPFKFPLMGLRIVFSAILLLPLTMAVGDHPYRVIWWDLAVLACAIWCGDTQEKVK